jgi:hypothetical protein
MVTLAAILWVCSVLQYHELYIVVFILRAFSVTIFLGETLVDDTLARFKPVSRLWLAEHELVLEKVVHESRLALEMSRSEEQKPSEEEKDRFIRNMEYLMGRPLTRQEINMAILQAEQIGHI